MVWTREACRNVPGATKILYLSGVIGLYTYTQKSSSGTLIVGTPDHIYAIP